MIDFYQTTFYPGIGKRYLMLLLGFLFLTSAFSARAQQKISGVVTSVEDKGTLPGVYVVEKGTSNTAATDAKGAFNISVSSGATLVFRMIGYVTQEVKVDSRSEYKIALATDVKVLNDILVIGYGSKNKSTYAGSAVTLSTEDLNKSSLSVANLLQGRVSGVQVSQSNGTPGASLSIRIRGTNSINANSEPLYVIDGFPTNNGVGFSVNPEDIASISILKDASSTSIYGARGANGVVMITTKSGKGQKSSINLDTYRGYSNVTKRFDLVGSYDYALRLNKLIGDDGGTPPYSATRLDSLKAGLLGTDWQDQLYRTAKMENYVVSFTGGNDNTSVYSSFDILDQEGVVIHSQFKRFGARVNVDHKISDKIKASGRVFGNYGIQNDLPLAPSSINGFVKQVLKANPASTFDSGVAAERDAQNPLHFLAATKRQNSVYRTNGYFSFNYEPIKNLVFKADVGTDINISKILYFAPSTVPAGVASKGIGTITNTTETELIFNPTANYTISTKGHTFQLLMGYNQQVYVYDESGSVGTNFSSDELGYDNLSIAQQFTAYSGKSKIKRQSWFGRLDYDYKNKYIFTGTYRIDGSVLFGPNNKLGYFPSAAVAWKFTEEDFVKDLGFFSSGKTRVSYGITGNDRINSGIALATFSGNNSTKYTFDGTTSVSGIAVTRLSNPNLKWEETTALDVGLDVGFFNDRLIVTADYYNKKTNDLLLDRSVAPSIGFQTLFGNTGRAENKGFELSLQTTNISNASFKWNSTFTYSANKNKVLSLGENNSDIYVGSVKPDGAANFETPFIIRVGEPVGSFYGYIYDGIIQQNDPVLTTTHKNAHPGDPKYVDADGNGIVNADDRRVLGQGIPTSFFGFTNNFTYKGFNLDIVTQGQLGGSLLNLQKEDLLNPVSQGNSLKGVINDLWSPENTSGTVPAFGFYGTTYGGWANSRFIESSDYFRVKNVTLGYTFNVSKLKSIGINGLNVYVNAQNLFTITKYTGLDPEVGNLPTNSQANQNAGRGIDFNAYPVNRMFLFGARVKF